MLAAHWKRKVTSKQLKSARIPIIGTLSDYINVEDDPSPVFRAPSSFKEFDLKNYWNSSAPDPIIAFTRFQNSEQNLRWSTDPKSLITLASLIHNNNLLSYKGKQNRIIKIMGCYKRKSFPTTLESVYLEGFSKRRSFNSISASRQYLLIAKSNGGITSDILGNVILGMCENNLTQGAYNLLKEHNHNLKVPERLRWLHTILESFARVGSFEASYRILKNMQQEMQFMYAASILPYICFLEGHVPQETFLITFFNDFFLNRSHSLSLETWVNFAVTAEMHRMSKLQSLLLNSASNIGAEFLLLLKNLVKLELILNQGDIVDALNWHKRFMKDFLNSGHWIHNKLITRTCQEISKCKSIVHRGELLGRLNFLFIQLRESKRHINNHSFLAILEAFGRAGNHTRCKSLLNTMKQRGLEVTVDHYYHLIEAYCESGSMILAHDVLQEMKASKIKPNTKCFVKIIAAYLAQSVPNYSKAFAYLRNMVYVNAGTTIEFYQVWIDHFTKTKNFSRAKEWMEIVEGVGSTPYVEAYNLLMDLALNSLDPNPEMVAFYFKSCLSSCKPNDNSYKYYFTASCILLSQEEAFTLWKTKPSLHESLEALTSLLSLMEICENFQLLEDLGCKIFAVDCAVPGVANLYHSYISCLLKQSRLELLGSLLRNQIVRKGIRILKQTSDLILGKADLLDLGPGDSVKLYLESISQDKAQYIGVATCDPSRIHTLLRDQSQKKLKAYMPVIGNGS